MKNYLLTLIILFSSFLHAQDSEFLPVEEAFPVTWEATGQGAVIRFDTHPGYYLYQSRFSFKEESSLSTLAPQYSLPGEEKQDPNFGNVVVFHDPLTVIVPYTGSGKLTVRYQGCADKGLCYLPQKLELDLPTLKALADVASEKPSNSLVQTLGKISDDTNGLSSFLSQAGKLQALLVFFLLGLGLSLTPCVLPMIPILASIIGGEKAMTGKKGAALSSSYVLGMATSYAMTGILVTTLAKGINLQAAMQQPWLLSIFAAVFVLLALAMFGFYELQLPAALQQKLNSGSDKLGGGKIASVFAMGAISALVVSPCVSAPLAGALLYVSTTQDWMFGGATLFVMALGMGVPLIAIGASGGRLLLKSGAWMVSVKQVFGVLLLAVAIVLLSRFVDPSIIMILWALLAIGTGVHFGALEAAQPGWARTRKFSALLPLSYGLILFVGYFLGNSDPLNPLANRESAQPMAITSFEKTDSVTHLEQQLQAAANAEQKVLVDLYADWCVSCKVIETNVFNDQQISQKLKEWQTIKLDVTESSPEQMAWLNNKNVFGPPAIFFYSPDSGELEPARVMGDIDKAGFNNKLKLANQLVAARTAEPSSLTN
ncbi:Thiol:disulfide interchange protein DsbD 1 [Vibrio chagasii]|nr:Thiol:disulfide interchange protein DsbD 1 [Vibrio chagasii]CAH6839131.1 Thiol:disulfide interchange protein DsbD 1 [Vibrio chagasii]CAH6862325.1 Thiol:disulfide interchange protein DsbD 1 [Vibrio chagasii]CAH7045431.1 Thiol:disulfide interchange protein DsbD 1 [Vibrio chagasii]CAH7064317.1 Thiol:disulfide interchange protein DsbD 1 [Vibrio chagasii]